MNKGEGRTQIAERRRSGVPRYLKKPLFQAAVVAGALGLASLLASAFGASALLSVFFDLASDVPPASGLASDLVSGFASPFASDLGA